MSVVGGFQISPQLPTLPLDDGLALVDMLSAGIGDLRVQAHHSVLSQLDTLKEAGDLLACRDLSHKYSVWPPTCQLRDQLDRVLVWSLDDLHLSHIVLAGFLNLVHLCFELSVPSSVAAELPIGVTKFSSPAPLLATVPPWSSLLTRWSCTKRKTQARLRIGFWLRIVFPLTPAPLDVDPRFCAHRFVPIDLGPWQWRLIWKCRVCGYICHCSCFELAIRRDPFPPTTRTPDGVTTGLASIPFSPDACEVCRDADATTVFCHEMYARSSFERRYGAYVKRTLVERGVTRESPDYVLQERAVTDWLRERLGYRKVGERFVAETQLHALVCQCLPGNEVIHHFRAPWLEGLELDIYVPRHRLGIEYQGIQHFAPVEAWGGDEGLRRNQARDARKVELCRRQGVRLILFTHDEELTDLLVRTRLAEVTCGVDA